MAGKTGRESRNICERGIPGWGSQAAMVKWLGYWSSGMQEPLHSWIGAQLSGRRVRDTGTKIRLCGETEGAAGVTVKSIGGKKVRLGTGTCLTFMF